MLAVMHDASRPVKCLLHDEAHYAVGIMTDAAERLRKARERSFKTAKEAAEAMGVAVSTYIQHESGIRGFPAARAEKYGQFFRVKPEWLLYGSGNSDKLSPLGPQLHIVGEVAAGVFKTAWERDRAEWKPFIGLADLNEPVGKRFGLEVVGDSMDMIYPPGTILECVRRFGGVEGIPSGKRVIVQRTRSDGQVEATVKELFRDADGSVWLVPRSNNPSHRAFRADRPDSDDITDVEVLALVVASTKRE